MKENEISGIIVDIAVNLHKKLGSGLLENVYEVILAKLLAQKGFHVQRQVSIPIEFEGEHFDEGFRLDLFIEGKGACLKNCVNGHKHGRNTKGEGNGHGTKKERKGYYRSAA